MEDFMKLCKYGCGRDAKYPLKSSNGELVVCEDSPNKCPVNIEKNRATILKAYNEGKVFGWKKRSSFIPWNKGLTKETSERIKNICEKSAKTYKEGIKSGRITPSFTGRHHSSATKEKLSIAACNRNNNNGFIKTKYYDVFCPLMDKVLKVQGTYEFAFTEYLNEINVKWIKTRKLSLRYKYFDDDYLHTYYPDIYLPDIDLFVETKGWWFVSKDGKINDRKKLEAVLVYNKAVKILVLEKHDLINLCGINLKKYNNRESSEKVDDAEAKLAKERKKFLKLLKSRQKREHKRENRLYHKSQMSDSGRKSFREKTQKLYKEKRKKLIEERIQFLKSIDINKFGCIGKIAKAWNVSSTQVRRFVEKYMSIKIYKRCGRVDSNDQCPLQEPNRF